MLKKEFVPEFKVKKDKIVKEKIKIKKI